MSFSETFHKLEARMEEAAPVERGKHLKPVPDQEQALQDQMLSRRENVAARFRGPLLSGTIEVRAFMARDGIKGFGIDSRKWLIASILRYDLPRDNPWGVEGGNYSRFASCDLAEGAPADIDATTHYVTWKEVAEERTARYEEARRYAATHPFDHQASVTASKLWHVARTTSQLKPPTPPSDIYITPVKLLCYANGEPITLPSNNSAQQQVEESFFESNPEHADAMAMLQPPEELGYTGDRRWEPIRRAVEWLLTAPSP